MSWILFSVLAAVAWAVVNVMDKIILGRLVKEPVVFIMVFGVIGILTSLVIYFFRGFSEMSYFNILLAFMAGIFCVLSTFFYFNAIKIEEISRVVPLSSVTPLFVSTLALIFLGEKLSIVEYEGTLLIVLGAILISSGFSLKVKFNKAFCLVLFSCCFLAIDNIIMKYLLGFADFLTVFSWIRIGIFFALMPVYVRNFPKLLEVTEKFGKKTLLLISFGECLVLIGFLFITIAASSGDITLVNAFSSTQPFFVLFFTIILTVFFPKILTEEIKGRVLMEKVLATVLIFAGVVMIS